ncbi:hypothetical protein M409DRAFT_22288 [Zasmidium cellare ATCC 36951]|uniref:Uncharacterized protein n=1 Tax=Zasmidium cellare ATCC 36951 TaxID=1080233 RepID=A0A6A6CMU8_ZASCE|nr:uncharacterized protein M409DRAFT_22288 [Zasmidium cellare ATCC 36951]KAF2167480.1 hypothetical protein M409DRAFT_22288 [Zasmidium cellare ATCC 36951]
MAAMNTLVTSLRFADGDLVIKLSANTSLDILIHKDVVAKHCKTLAPALGKCDIFDKSIDINMPGKITPMKLYSLGLKFVDRTLVLEGQSFQGLLDELYEDADVFDHSVLATADWPDPCGGVSQTGYNAQRNAAHQYLLIFKILYGKKLSGKDFEDITTWVAAAVVRYLHSCESLWAFVAEEPRQTMLLAIKLRDKEIYFHSVRHMIADPERTYWSQLLAQQEVGDRVYVEAWGTRRSQPAGPLSEALSQIQRFVAIGEPAMILGPDVAGEIVTQFGLPRCSTKAIHRHLCKIVEDAAEATKKAFVVKEEKDERGKTVTYRQARHDCCAEYWTYLPWEESKFPWMDEKEWDALLPSSGGLDMTPASKEQLGVVDIQVIEADPEESRDEGSGGPRGVL